MPGVSAPGFLEKDMSEDLSSELQAEAERLASEMEAKAAAEWQAAKDNLPQEAQPIEHVVEVVLTPLAQVVHEIEHRSFGRPSADHPMVVTTTRSN